VNLPRKYSLGLGRTFVASLGICSIAWSLSSLQFSRAEALLSSSATAILAGESYNAGQLTRLKQDIEAIPADRIRPSSLRDVAVVRLRQLDEGKASNGSYLALAAVTMALTADPSDSFLWLAEFWLYRQRADPAERDLDLLRRSYLSGPNEGWIAIKRNSLALGIFPSLSNDLVEQALSEFAGIVRSGLYPEAANILAGPGWPIREHLLSRVAQLDDTTRRGFASVLAYKNIDVDIPGMDNGSSRPF
jgi:hypothetical protein